MRIQNEKHGMEGKNTKLRDYIGGLELVRGGEKVREREKRRKADLFKQTLKVMFHIITGAYESCFSCQTLISN